MSAETGLYVGLAMLAGFLAFSIFLIVLGKKSGSNSDEHKNDK